MADPNIIGGQIPFGPAGNPYQGGGIGNLGNAYQTSYNTALGQNQAMYNNVLQGYQQTMAKQTSAQDAIAGGYSNLYNTVLGGIQGIGASQQQNIQDTYAQQKGATQQSMVSRGLGNTTVSDSAQRGLTLDEQKAQIALQNQLAQLQAGYQSSLGLAGLNQANTANMQNTGLAGQQLGWMNSVTAQYPNTAAYNQLAQMSGAASQADKDRAAMLQVSNRGGATAGAAGGGVNWNQGGSLAARSGPMIRDVTSLPPQQQQYGNAGGPQMQYINGYNSGPGVNMQLGGQGQYSQDTMSLPADMLGDMAPEDIQPPPPQGWADLGDYWGQDFTDY